MAVKIDSRCFSEFDWNRLNFLGFNVIMGVMNYWFE